MGRLLCPRRNMTARYRECTVLRVHVSLRLLCICSCIIQCPAKQCLWLVGEFCSTFMIVQTVLPCDHFMHQWNVLLMLMTGLWSKNVKTQFVSSRNIEFILWPESDVENVLLWNIDISRPSLNRLYKTKVIPTLIELIRDTHISTLWSSYGIIHGEMWPLDVESHYISCSRAIVVTFHLQPSAKWITITYKDGLLPVSVSSHCCKQMLICA